MEQQLLFGLQVQLNAAQVLDVFDEQPIHRENWNLLLGFAVDVLTFLSVLKPALCREVHRLSNVDARRKACMVRSRERQDELSGFLQGFVDLDSIRGEVCGRDHGDDVQQNVWVFLENEAELLLDCLFELLPVVVGHTVPHLGLAPVAVVDGVKHKVFVMPAEG